MCIFFGYFRSPPFRFPICFHSPTSTPHVITAPFLPLSLSPPLADHHLSDVRAAEHKTRLGAEAGAGEVPRHLREPAVRNRCGLNRRRGVGGVWELVSMVASDEKTGGGVVSVVTKEGDWQLVVVKGGGTCR